MERYVGARIYLCGEFTATFQGDQRAEIARGQLRLLFAYLLLNRERPLSRDELAAAVWPEQAPSHYSQSLSVLLSRLRRILAEKASLEGRTELRLCLPDETWIDLEAARGAVTEAESSLKAGEGQSAHTQASLTLSILGGGLLPGHEAPWLDRCRRECDEMSLRALECVAAIGVELEDGELAASERAARSLTEREPYRESGYRWLMRVHEAHGDVAEALRVYERLRVLLREELGTTPAPELQALHRHLLELGSTNLEKEPDQSDSVPTIPGPLNPRSEFVGREQPLDHLKSAWRSAASGESQLLLISGEAGIGKTRVCAELARMVREQGKQVLYGRCDEEMVIPYQPFIEALNYHCEYTPADRLREQIGGYGDQLARLLPDLTDALPDLPKPRRGGSGDDRFRLFEQVTSLLAQISLSSVLLLIIDDLHWADQGTLLMLRHIVRSQLKVPMLILGTYRTTEVKPTEPLAGFLADCTREQLAERMTLEGLGREEVGQLISAWAGQSSSEKFTAALHSETEGNPFFIGEVLRHLVENGSLEMRSGRWTARVPISQVGIPTGVQEALDRRLARLSEATTQMLRRASVLGREFDLDALAHMSTESEHDLLGLIEQAEQAHLIGEAPETIGRYSFSHALIQGALYESLGATRRTRLHEQIGQAIEDLSGDALEPHLAELARHFSRSSSQAAKRKAIEYSIRAGHQARSQFAFEEAALHFARALEALKAAGGSPRRRLGVLLDLGSSQNAGGNHPAAQESFLEAIELAGELGTPNELARATLGYCGHALELGTVDLERVAIIERALKAVGEKDSRARADLLSRLALEVYYTGPERRERLSAEAVAISRRLSDGVALARALVSRRVALAGSPDIEQRLEITTELLALAHAGEATEIALWGHTWRATDLLDRCEVDGAYEEIDQYAILAREYRQPAYLWHISLFAAMRKLFEGDLDEIEGLIGEGMRVGIQANDPNASNYFGILVFMLRRDQGRLEEIESEVKRVVELYPAVPAWRCGLALLYAEVGNSARAHSELQRLSSEGFAGIPLDINWLPGMTWLAITCGLLEEAELAATLYDMLGEHAERNVTTGHPIFCLGSMSQYLGILASLRDDLPSARAHFEYALKSNGAMRTRSLLAHTKHEYARALLRLGGPQERQSAMGLLREAIDQANAIGLDQLRSHAQSTERDHALALR